MCELEDHQFLTPNLEFRYLGVFLNLGLIQGDQKLKIRKLVLCEDCQFLLDEIRKWVSENTDVFYTLDRAIEKRDLNAFIHDLWPNLFDTIVVRETALNEGRLFALLICLTRAGMIWRVKGIDLTEISRVHHELQVWLKIRLPNYDWQHFSDFVTQISNTKQRSLADYANYLLFLFNLGVILFKFLSWNPLGGRYHL